jgi:WhiB family redox-sensing transcriptional regulator
VHDGGPAETPCIAPYRYATRYRGAPVALDDLVLEALMQPGAPGDSRLVAAVAQWRPPWMAEGACSQESTGRFFAMASSKPAAWALAACQRCPVRSTCLAFALEHEEYGIWGGTTDRERMALLRAQGATTWAELAEDSQEALLAAAAALRRDAVDDATPMAPAVCEHCGEPTSERYCSSRCRSAASYHRRRAAPCEFCGGETPKQFCNQECRSAAWDRRRAEKASL